MFDSNVLFLEYTHINMLLHIYINMFKKNLKKVQTNLMYSIYFFSCTKYLMNNARVVYKITSALFDETP